MGERFENGVGKDFGIIGESGGLGTESEAIRDSGTHSNPASGPAAVVPSDPLITAISAALEAAAKAGQFDVVQSLAAQLVMLRIGNGVPAFPQSEAHIPSAVVIDFDTLRKRRT